MNLDIQLTNAPIPDLLAVPAEVAALAGAWVEFRGLIRGEENGRPITGLEYEAYDEMARRELRRIAEELGRDYPCLAARIIHRVGVVPVGEAAIYIGVAAAHRTEAFALLSTFMTRLKQDVPVWKRRAQVAAGEPPASESRILAPGQPPELSTPSAHRTPFPASEMPGSTGSRKPAATIEDVLALVRANCVLLEPERVALSQAAGRILREPISAPEDQPVFDRSAMDGYAVRLDDPASQLRIVDEIRAGDWKPRQLQHEQAVRIATGGALPGEGLQVLMKEEVQVEGATLHVVNRSNARNIRFRGEDARAGKVLLEGGTMLRPGGLALLASLGQVQPLVTRLPRVLHLATGNEIVPPEARPQRGQIRDSNSTLVRAFLHQFGVEARQVRVAEERAQAEAALLDGLAGSDLLLVSGGASVGEHDFTRALLESLEFRVHLCRTNTRPGKPLIFATRRDGKVAFGLPGNPLAHFVCLHLFVRAALETLGGQAERSPFATAYLAAELKAKDNPRETLWPAEVCEAGGCARATPLRWSSSGDVTCLARANALLRVSPDCGALPAGAAVAFVSTLYSA